MKEESILTEHIRDAINKSNMFTITNNLVEVFRKFGYRKTQKNKLKSL